MDYHHPSLNDESDWCSKKMKDNDTVFAVFYDQKGPETLHFTSTKAVTRYHKSLVSRIQLFPLRFAKNDKQSLVIANAQAHIYIYKYII